MRNRILVSIAIVAVLALFYILGYYVSKYIMDLLISFVIFCAVNEMRRALKDRIPKEFDILIFVYSISIGVLCMLPSILPKLQVGYMGVLYYTLIIFGLGVTLAVFRNIHLDGIMNFAFILIYPGLTLTSLFFINGSPLAALGLALVLIVSTFSDACALIFGLLFGKHKLAPLISPKKTIEGAVGGVFGGLLGATLVYFVFEVFCLVGPGFFEWGLRPFNVYLSYITIGIIGSCLTQIGDLVASIIKRSLELKDFSRLLGSHGGMLDRVDGLMLNACFVSFVFTFIALYPVV